MIRKLFIGSSSEGLDIADALKVKLEEQLSTFIECHIWTDGKIFSLNKSALDALMVASRKFDYGVLVATKDDIAKVRDVEVHIPRDNVMFEMGMFLGSLGLTRAFLLVEKFSKLPTDYNGITVPYFEKDIDGSLDKAIEKIVEAISNTKKSYNLKPVPSAALALSYFDNFVQPLARKRLKDGIAFDLKIIIPDSINDVYVAIDFYKAKHRSEEISVYNDGARPRVYKLTGKKHHYWDVPTTLATLNKLISLVNPSNEIGFEQDKHDWIDHELRNFKGTLEVLVEQCPACRNNVVVEYA